jgi:predicted NBD/HSP70 family sugar kinase
LRRDGITRLLRAVQGQPGIAQADLAAEAGLAAGPVSELVRLLADHGMLEAIAAPSTGERGRPRRSIHLADARAHLVGVHLGGSGFAVRVATLAGRELARVDRAWSGAPPDPAAAGVMIGSAVGELIRDGTNPRRCQLAVSVPGAVRGGKIGSRDLEWHWTDEALFLDPLRGCGLSRVLIGNDGAFATLAEHRSGAAMGADNVVVLYMGRGLGGSAITSGHLVLGHDAGGGLGHVPIDPNGPLCLCGRRGCAELSASLRAIAAKTGLSARLADHSASGFAVHLVKLAKDGTPGVLAALDAARDAIRSLGELLAAVLGPERIVLSGAAQVLAPWLLTPRIGLDAPHLGRCPVPMVEGEHGADAIILGAVLAAQDAAIADPDVPGIGARS